MTIADPSSHIMSGAGNNSIARESFPGRTRYFLFFLLLLAFSASPVFGRQQAPLPVFDSLASFNDDLARLVENSIPAVVSISTIKFEADMFAPEPFVPGEIPQMFDDPPGRTGIGSGTIINVLGKPYILTNQHVVAGVDRVIVRLHDSREFDAVVKGWDPKVDIALLEIEGIEELSALPVGDSDLLKPGQMVFAVGSPFGLPHSITAGIVSAVGRHNQGIEEYEDFIQTDAAINRGNSGGPLLNLNGEIVGLNTAIRTTQFGGNVGVGFAIPMNMIMPVAEQLVRHGHVARGWLGASVQDINEELAAAFRVRQTTGVIVTRVVPGTPADAGGLLRGDIILRIDDAAIENVNKLRNHVANTLPGSLIRVNVVRDGRERNVMVTLGEIPYAVDEFKPEAAVARRWDGIGAAFQDVSIEIARAIGAPDPAGAVVTGVEPGSPASQARPVPLARGDVIVECGRQEIRSVGDLQRRINATAPGGYILLYIYRRGSNLFTVVRVPE